MRWVKRVLSGAFVGGMVVRGVPHCQRAKEYSSTHMS